MMAKQRTPSVYQRNAFAPGLLAAAVLFLAPVLMGGDWFTLVLFVAAILAVVVGWFAIQARQWWWVPVFAAIVVIWNPVFPFPFRYCCASDSLDPHPASSPTTSRTEAVAIRARWFMVA